MASFLAALTTIVLPILLVAAVGFILGRTRVVTDTRTLARVALYFFNPVLLLNSLSQSRMGASDFVSILAFAVLVAAIMGIFSFALTRLLNFDRVLASAFMLSIIFVNAGNIGLPFNQFAFGDDGLARAAVYFVGNSILSQTLAVYLASRGRYTVKESVFAVLKLPLIYALVIGIAANLANVAMPPVLARALDLAAGGALPLMLVILGLELARVQLRDYNLTMLLATGIKLLVTPAVALVLAEVMNLRGITRAVAVLEASMPTAVLASVIALHFDARSEFVTSVVFSSTLGSIVTLVLLLLFLGYSPS